MSNITAIVRQYIKSNGQVIDLDGPHTMHQIRAMIGARSIGVVKMKRKPMHVMLVDDEYIDRQLPRNEKATAIYHETCLPGTKHPICGDVVIAPDSDFEGESNDL